MKNNKEVVDFLKSDDGAYNTQRFIKALEEGRVFAVLHGRTNSVSGTKYVGFYEHPRTGGSLILNFHYVISKLTGRRIVERDNRFVIPVKGYADDVALDVILEVLGVLDTHGVYKIADRPQNLRANISVL